MYLSLSYDNLSIVAFEPRKSIFEVHHSNGVTFYLYQLVLTFKPNVYSYTRMNLVSFTLYVLFI